MMNNKKLGGAENPHRVAPPDFETRGLGYGDFCLCSTCGLVARSTIIFDYYAQNPGDPLRCERCVMGAPSEQAAHANAIAERIITESN
jgi:hypothetical protein